MHYGCVSFQSLGCISLQPLLTALADHKRYVFLEQGWWRDLCGITSKIHLCVEGHCLPLSVLVTAGQCSYAVQIGPVLDAICVPRSSCGRPCKRPTYLRVDRAYGVRYYRAQIQQRGMRCICPDFRMREPAGYANRGGASPPSDAQAYEGRNVVDAINRLKDFRAVEARYDKRGNHFLSAVIVAYGYSGVSFGTTAPLLEGNRHFT